MPPKKSIDDAQVLEKAFLIISELGPESFTLADVAKAVNLSPATLLQRFGSKRALLIKAAKHVPAQMKKRKKKQNWKQELIALFAELPEGLRSRGQLANSLGLLKLDMVDPELHPIARELFEQLRGQIKELLERGKGELEPQMDVAQTAWELDALRHGLIIQWALSGEGSIEEWLRQGLDHYLKGKRR